MADELRDSVVDQVDLVLYDEAWRCLDADAYRAAYVMSWIAAAEGILGKLRTMATLHAALGTFVRESADPWRLLDSGVRFEHVAHAIVRRLDGPSFQAVGAGVGLLRSTEDDVLARLDDDLQFELGRALAYAANRNTFAAINEIEGMTHNLPRWPAALLVDELRAILDNAEPAPAVEKLKTFIERVEPPARHLPPPVK